MTEPGMGATLRERTRRAVQAELLAAGQALFVERGFDAVTVEEIAAAAGMSKRSFFRYFGSKEALILGKFDKQGEDFAAALAQRPLDEQPWVALRRMFDPVVTYMADEDSRRSALEVNRLIQNSEALRAGYLERMERAQRLIAIELERREAERGSGATSLQLAAVVAAAFAALSTAHRFAESHQIPLANALDEAVSAIARGGFT
ncbi:TetR family transcriptional regulator [Microbacterium excoecariae]|uniref:TetR family transcriptional regulator n=1 Tax=Microbacterium excoecariae TaxID=2715210 RepID=UPI00140DE6FC|nr:TetR family transcriptional regulator [Microbacterium excoecariae]NHI17548.1 TetR family transcriptional regulator [Microbacterium excoecariae]